MIQIILKIYDIYKNFEEDLKGALQYLNPDNPFIDPDIISVLKEIDIDFQINEEHKQITDNVLSAIRKNRTQQLMRIS